MDRTMTEVWIPSSWRKPREIQDGFFFLRIFQHFSRDLGLRNIWRMRKSNHLKMSPEFWLSAHTGTFQSDVTRSNEQCLSGVVTETEDVIGGYPKLLGPGNIRIPGSASGSYDEVGGRYTCFLALLVHGLKGVRIFKAGIFIQVFDAFISGKKKILVWHINEDIWDLKVGNWNYLSATLYPQFSAPMWFCTFSTIRSQLWLSFSSSESSASLPHPNFTASFLDWPRK